MKNERLLLSLIFYHHILNPTHRVLILHKKATDTLSWPHNVKVGNDISMYGKPNDISYLDTNQWKLLHYEGFEEIPTSWSYKLTSTCGQSTNHYLGGICKNSNAPASYSQQNIPEHEMVKITFNFHFFGEWKGESAYLKVNGNVVWTYSYNWCDKVLPWACKQYAVLGCGTETPMKMGHHAVYIGQHHLDYLNLEFGTNLPNDPCSASYGLDDVSIYIQ